MKQLYILILLATTACTKLTPMPNGVPVPPPAQVVEYCRTHVCVDKTKTNDMIVLTPKVRRDIQEAHSHLRATFVPESEPVGEDNWQLSMTGDCEDYVLSLIYHMSLLQPKYAAAFRMATAETENGDYHAVMVINDTDGVLVCDLRFPECAPWQSFPYKYDLKQTSNGWERLPR